MLSLDEFASELEHPSTPPAESMHARVVRLASGEFDRFASLCRQSGLVLLDTIDRQLEDLAAVRLPSSNRAERQRYIEELLTADGEREIHGNWIYLPWEGRVVHLLAAEAYFEVITDRNRDKITSDEQRLLRTRRIGVVGLSVGGEAAVTVAQEHLCGEIMLADFDRLDLSNLNRMGAGIDDLGRNKAMIVARRIARIDPYLAVTVFTEGVTEANLDAFLDGLDLLIEECDGLGIKHEVRRRARQRGLNIVFAADERGFLSIEPYADRPELLPFHGRIEARQPSREEYDTPLAFLRALTEWMGGWDRISDRSRRSLEQIGTSLCGYPQLASEARYAAGQIGHVSRRLLLGERLRPFLGNLDLEEMLTGDP
jgi:tRNA threonylcarbamoyladenosine dehydratase